MKKKLLQSKESVCVWGGGGGVVTTYKPSGFGNCFLACELYSSAWLVLVNRAAKGLFDRSFVRSDMMNLRTRT